MSNPVPFGPVDSTQEPTTLGQVDSTHEPALSDQLDSAVRSDAPAPPTSSPTSSPTGTPTLLSGPYAFIPLDEVALLDPDYLLDLVREGVGESELRAEAARALAARDRLPPARIARTLALATIRRIGSPRPPPRPWAAVFGLGIAVVAVVAFLGRSPSVIEVFAALPSRALDVLTADPASTAQVSVDRGSDAQVSVDRGSDAHESGGDGNSAPGAFADSTGTGGAGRSPAETTASRQSPASGQLGNAGSPGSPGSPAGGPSISDTASIRSNAGAGSSAQPCGARIPGAIPAESVEDFVDTHQSVEFEVVGTKDTGRVTFLNSHDPYQGYFYVAIFPDDYPSFPEPPALFFRGSCVVVRGTIERYRGTPQIVLRDPDDVRVVPEP